MNNTWSEILEPKKYQFFEKLPIDKATESFETILQRPGLKIERIVSNGHRSADDFWYEQESDEWVLLLSGAAVLAFSTVQNEMASLTKVTLLPGEAIHIPAGQRHQVVCTEPDKPTIWLAIHFN
jgi:cupin 2 domain-containing protein